MPPCIACLLHRLIVACLLVGMTAGTTLAQVGGTAILLVASNRLDDPRFARSVVLVTRHGRSPPLGVIINRPLETTVGRLFPKLPQAEAQQPLFFGGPLGTSSLVFVYRNETGSSDAIAVAGDLFLGRSGETLGDLLRGRKSHRGLRVFAGYSGWGPGQLEEEIRRGDWHVLPVDADLIFNPAVDRLWPELIGRASERST